MTSKITFEGEAPFQLPEIQSAQADRLGGDVLLFLYSVIDGHGPGRVRIMGHMTPLVALALSKQLTEAATLAARDVGWS